MMAPLLTPEAVPPEEPGAPDEEEEEALPPEPGPEPPASEPDVPDDPPSESEPDPPDPDELHAAATTSASPMSNVFRMDSSVRAEAEGEKRAEACRK